MRTPEFWYDRNRRALATMLAPAGALYGLAGALRGIWVRPRRALVPVLCVGNAVAGGAGKTPVALALARRLIDRGTVVHFLTRGYGGSRAGPVRVDANEHTSKEVGDEALLLARVAPTWVARNRRAGCKAAALAGAGVIIMDDGLQNPAVAKDVSVLVIDGAFGFGNGKLIPAGPLREPPARALARVQGVVLIGDDRAGVMETLRKTGTTAPVLHAALAPGPEADALEGARIMAFAGIGLPEKFFAYLRALGCDVAATQAFADHHAYTPADIAALHEKAKTMNARLVTTEKDFVRVPRDHRAGIVVLAVSVAWHDELAVDDLLDGLSGGPSGGLFPAAKTI